MQAAAIIVAAGRGLRAGGEIPKQYQPLCGRPVLEHTIAAFASHPEIAQVLVAIHADDETRFRNLSMEADWAPVTSVHGGATRDVSVRCGLASLDDETERVLIHDAARPLVSVEIIDRVLAALRTSDGAAPALAVTDALWRGKDGLVAGTQDRSHLYRAQTPQGFRVSAIRRAHKAHAAQGLSAADDVEVARHHGIDVSIVPGDEDNMKITLPEDLARARTLLEGRRSAMDVRTGSGFDVHKFGPGNQVVLCGVAVPHDHGLVGHSDADVGMHALTDAIYGALADGDIGQHFPPSDPQWKGADSRIFLEHAVERAARRGFRVGNADVTLICERPKIGPHAQAMRGALAGIVAVGSDRISVKATTSERLGFTGRGEGIAALASVTLVSR